jgi:isopentenyl diphosphate isomerase/L-lactate dehydrogenase-like FMN-dependent dehydrogenase
MSTTVMGQTLKMPLFCSPTALQRLFHHEGERAVAKAAEKFGTMFGVSSLGTVSVEEIGSAISTPKPDAFDPGENVWHQIASLIGLRISSISDLIVCRPVDIVEDRPG